jgi:DNA (cytosine-5)-methyltransferase 1
MPADMDPQCCLSKDRCDSDTDGRVCRKFAGRVSALACAWFHPSKTFVAENVSGLVKGTAKGWFIEVLRALKPSGYRVSARLLDAQWLGVPQMRQRIIFVGVREDLRLEPTHPEPLPYRYSVRDALPHLTACKTVAHGYTREDTLSLKKPAPSLTMTNGASYQQHHVQSETMLPGDC